MYSYGRSRASNQICHGAFFVKSLKVQTRLREFLKIIPFIPGVPNEAPTVGQTGGSGGHWGYEFYYYIALCQIIAKLKFLDKNKV